MQDDALNRLPTEHGKGRWQGQRHEGLCLAMKGTSLRIQQHRPTASVGCRISGIITQLHRQELKHTPLRQLSQAKGTGMLTLGLLPGHHSLNLYTNVHCFLSISCSLFLHFLTSARTHLFPALWGKWKPVTVKCISQGTMCKGLFYKTSQGDMGATPLSLTSTIERKELPQ